MCNMRQGVIQFSDTFKSIKYLDYIGDLFEKYQNFRSKKYSQLSLEILQKRFKDSNLWLTHSATGALEMIAQAIKIQPGDEVILSSFTFVSTVNAFVNYGAKPIFVDIDEERFNLDISKVEEKITERTKAIIITHYAGHASDLNQLKTICEKHQLYLIEDAAMAYGNTFEGKSLGTIGDFGVISFDITKQISAVQGGVLICNRPDFQEIFDPIYHIGTNRTQFIQNALPYYEWVDKGSKFQMNEMNAVVLYDHLLHETEILNHRQELSKSYFEQLKSLQEIGIKMLPSVEENIHLFYLLLRSEEERKSFIDYMKENRVEVLFHYIPLHTSRKGMEYCDYRLPVVEKVSNQLVRLPMHHQLTTTDVDTVCQLILNFFKAI